MNTAIKSKPCKCCKALFTPVRPLARACSPLCAMDLVRQANAKKAKLLESANRKETKAKLEKLKTRSEWLADCQKLFNAWIKIRDRDLPCVSCGITTAQIWHAGHFKSVGASPANRFNPLNVAKQCPQCNLFKSGNLLNYRIELVKRIGLDQVEKLEGPQGAMKWTIIELKQMKMEFSEMLKKAKSGAS